MLFVFSEWAGHDVSGEPFELLPGLLPPEGQDLFFQWSCKRHAEQPVSREQKEVACVHAFPLWNVFLGKSHEIHDWFVSVRIGWLSFTHLTALLYLSSVSKLLANVDATALRTCDHNIGIPPRFVLRDRKSCFKNRTYFAIFQNST